MLKQFLFLSLVEGLYRLGQVLITATVARTLGPSGYGLIATAQAFSNYASVVADGGTGLHGMHKIAAERKKGTLGRTVISQVVSARIIMSMVVYLALGAIALIWMEGALVGVMMLSGLVTLAVALRIDWLAKGTASAQLMAIPNLIALAVTLIFLLLFVKDESNIYAAALIPVVSVAVSGFVLFMLMRRKMPDMIGLCFDLRPIIEVIQRSFPAAVGTLAQGGSHLVPLLFLGTFGLAELGYFNAAYNLVFPVAALAIYFMNSAIPHVQVDGVEQLQKIRQAIMRAAGFGAIVGGFVAIIAPLAVEALYGYAYAASGQVMQILAIALAIQFVRHMLRGMAVVRGANVRHEFSSGMLATLLSLLVCALLVDEYGALGGAVAVCVGEFAGTASAWILLRKSLRKAID